MTVETNRAAVERRGRRDPATRAGVVAAIALLAAALGGAGCAARPRTANGSAAQAYRVESYRVALALDLATRTLVATTTLRIRPGDDPELRFPLAGLVVDRVSTAGARVPFTYRDGVLTLRIPPPANPGDPVEVTVAYHGAPAKGLAWGARSVHTTFHSCGWMVCDQDRPGERTPVELELVVPADLDVVASGDEVAAAPAGPGLVRHTWRQARPYPSYLFAFAVGRFVKVALPSRPPGLEVVAEGTPPERAAAEAGFDVPLAWAGPYPSLGMKRRIAYAKGALFLDALRGTLGEAAFWDGLRRYTRENVDRSVESRDLQRAMEAASGRDLSALFAEWVYGR